MKFIDLLGSFYLKFPPLSLDLREFIVKILSPLSLIAGLLLTIAAIIDFLGTPILSAFTLGGGSDFIRGLLITNTLGVIQGVMMIFAFPPLRKRKLTGWKLLFWAQIIWIAASLITFSPWFLLSIILFYFLYQVKSSYR